MLRPSLCLLLSSALLAPAAYAHREEVIVHGRQVNLVGRAASASEGLVSQEELARRPRLRAGEVLESVPGLIKVRLIDRQVEKKASGLYGWVSSGGSVSSKPAPMLRAQGTDLDLHMERRDPDQPNKLTITLVMRPAGGLASADWRHRAQTIGRDLQAYLMGR